MIDPDQSVVFLATHEHTDTTVVADFRQAASDAALRNRALGSAIWNNPELILHAAAQLRDSNATIECRLRGASMTPTIPMGARLQIKFNEGAPYRQGDVVAFVLDGDICVHRVVHRGLGRRSQNHLITQGDACLCPDPPICVSRVLGRVMTPDNDQGFAPPAPQPPVARSGSFPAKTLLTLVACFMELDIRVAQFSARLATSIGLALPHRFPVGGVGFKLARRNTHPPDRR